ncbi:MAG TPA: hypothetical protein VLG40_04885 [Candidatus Saccharimonas sp.]|nr:hypothetical protein [Candidatus Saccharimonas sp.]
MRFSTIGELLFSRSITVSYGGDQLLVLNVPYDTTVDVRYAVQCQTDIRRLLVACEAILRGKDLAETEFGDFEISKSTYCEQHAHRLPFIMERLGWYVPKLCAEGPMIADFVNAEQDDLRITSHNVFVAEAFFPSMQFNMHLEYPNEHEGDGRFPLDDIRCFFTAASQRWQDLVSAGGNSMAFGGNDYTRVGVGNDFERSLIEIAPAVEGGKLAPINGVLGDLLQELAESAPELSYDGL